MPRKGVVANTHNAFRNGAVGFIDWLDLGVMPAVEFMLIGLSGLSVYLCCAVKSWVAVVGLLADTRKVESRLESVRLFRCEAEPEKGLRNIGRRETCLLENLVKLLPQGLRRQSERSIPKEIFGQWVGPLQIECDIKYPGSSARAK